MRTVAAAFGLTVGLAACIPHDPLNPRFLSGDDAAKRVDVYVGGMVAASHPAVVVGRARCPYLIDLSGNRMGRCTLPVTGGEMRVDVSAANAPTSVDPLDTLVVRSEAEPHVASELGGPVVRAAVRCPGPAVRVVANYTTIRCTFRRIGTSHGSVHVDFHGYDGVTVLYSKKLETKTDAAHDAKLDGLLGRAVLAQTSARILLDGPKLGSYLRAFTYDGSRDELARRDLIGPARCPRRIALTTRTHAVCSVRVDSDDLPYEIRFDRGRGLVVTSDHTIVSLARIRERAKRYFAHVIPIIDPSIPAASRISIDCGSDLVSLLVPGEALPCTAYAADRPFRFDARLLDGSGSIIIVARAGLVGT